MTAVTVPTQILPRIEPSQYMRNELVVTPNAQQGLVAGANQVLAQRPKELYSSLGAVGATSVIPVSTSTRVRWYAAGHTSPYAAELVFDCLVARPTAAGAAGARLEVLDATESSVLATIDLAYAGVKVNDTPDEFQELIGTVAIAADTEVILRISDTGKGRLVQALVYEQAAAADTASGYFATDVANGVSITSAQRSAIAAAMTTMWKSGGAAIFTAQAHDLDPALTSTTDTNIFNTSVTVINSTSPGITLDMRYKNRASKTTVPVRMRVRGSCTIAGTGHVRLKDSGGTTMLDAASFATTDGWIQVDGTLPATEAKYDLMLAGGGEPDAAAFVGAGTIALAGSLELSVAMSAVATRPAVSAGDTLFYLHLYTDDNARVVTAPSGWTLFLALAELDVWRKTATGSEPSTYTFSSTMFASARAAVIVAYSHIDPSAAAIGSGLGAITANGDGTSSATCPSQTMPDAHDLYLGIALVRDATGFTPPAGCTERYDANYAYNEEEGEVTVFDKIGAAGATGAKVAIAAGVDSNVGITYSIAISATRGTLTVKAVSIYELET